MHKWDSLSKPDRVKLLASAGLPTGLAQLKWSGLQKSERRKLEKGKGWFEAKEPIMTASGIEHLAPEHHRVAIKKEAGKANNKPMERKEPIASKKSKEEKLSERRYKEWYDKGFAEAGKKDSIYKDVKSVEEDIEMVKASNRTPAPEVYAGIPNLSGLESLAKLEGIKDGLIARAKKAQAKTTLKEKIAKLEADNWDLVASNLTQSEFAKQSKALIQHGNNIWGLIDKEHKTFLLFMKPTGYDEAKRYKEKREAEQTDAQFNKLNLKIGDVLYSKHNGTPYKYIGAKGYSTNKGVFGLEEHYTKYKFESKGGMEKELFKDQVLELLSKTPIENTETPENLYWDGDSWINKGFHRDAQGIIVQDDPDNRTDEQILKDLEIEYNSSNRRALKDLTPREQEALNRDAIRKYPITSAYIGALTTISGTQDKELKSFDKAVREELEKAEQADKPMAKSKKPDPTPIERMEQIIKSGKEREENEAEQLKKAREKWVAEEKNKPPGKPAKTPEIEFYTTPTTNETEGLLIRGLTKEQAEEFRKELKEKVKSIKVEISIREGAGGKYELYTQVPIDPKSIKGALNLFTKRFGEKPKHRAKKELEHKPAPLLIEYKCRDEPPVKIPIEKLDEEIERCKEEFLKPR